MNKKKIKKIIRILLFVSLIIFSIFLINIYYEKKILSEENLVRNYYQFKEAYDNNLKILIIGDSHFSWAINPIYLNNSFNFAIPSETTKENYYKSKKIISEDNNIEIIIMPYDFNTFSNTQEGEFDNFEFWKKFLPKEKLIEIKNISKMEIYKSYIPKVIGNGENLFIILNLSKRTDMILGWQNKTNNFVIKKKKEAPLIAKIKPELLDYYIKTLDLINESGKKAILIKAPITNFHVTRFNQESIKNYYKKLDNITSKYSNLYYLDYSNWSHNSNYQLFEDKDHLNYRGAELFTRELSEDLKKLGLIE